MVPRESLASALLASLGHDLRTRLTVIGAAASNLKGSTLSAEDQSEQSDLILTEVGRLNWLLQNIMEMGRIDASAMRAEPAWRDPSEIVMVARRLVAHSLDEHRLEVVTDVDALVQLDLRLTATALAHLLENAAQYSPSGSTIEVTTRLTGGELMIEVRDHGPGIGLSDLPHLFEQCYRGADAEARRSGTGMGLWITYRLLAVAHGRIWAENRSDGGAQFTIAVPTKTHELEQPLEWASGIACFASAGGAG